MIITTKTTPTIVEVKEALVFGDTVIYKSIIDGTIYILNPLGGGANRTGEFLLNDSFTINNETVKSMVIVSIN